MANQDQKAAKPVVLPVLTHAGDEIGKMTTVPGVSSLGATWTDGKGGEYIVDEVTDKEVVVIPVADMLAMSPAKEAAKPAAGRVAKLKKFKAVKHDMYDPYQKIRFTDGDPKEAELTSWVQSQLDAKYLVEVE